jgi:putative Ca2+/H+ antiporter (TMEM165/GDT1 family)
MSCVRRSRSSASPVSNDGRRRRPPVVAVHTNAPVRPFVAVFLFRATAHLTRPPRFPPPRGAAPTDGDGKGSTGAAAPTGADGKASSAPSEDIGSASTPGSGGGVASSGGDVEAGRLLGEADPSGKQAGMKTRRDTAAGLGGLPLLLHYCKKDWGILTQAFTLTFLAEWGDRSQIATIAMAAAQDPVGITAGAVIGHSLCTGLAVLGGRMLAARISEKTVATGGGALFMIFAAHSFWVGPEQV